MALEKILAPAAHSAAQSRTTETERKLNIAVVFTSPEATLAAIKEAGKLAENLSARLELVVAQVVPFPLPLESPPVLIEFSENRLREIASQSPVETTVRIYLCRDSGETLAKVLKPASVVVLGGRRRWWPTRESALARKLQKAGHEVVFKEME
ncbi:MAG TPA: hypothetical protein VN841_27660 [Bryobacteraceae bacterium]|nr:hypothetical protein [Bryobacteraceae bacterium]